jgi:asparagine synthase (glutamine-hydrolysing)
VIAQPSQLAGRPTPGVTPDLWRPHPSADAAPPCVILSWNDGRSVAHGTTSCVLGGERSATGRRPVGVFAEWHWNGQRLEARTDRFGIQPLFYAASGSRLWLSPSIPELVRRGAPTELDDSALAVFLRLGHFLGDDTPFRGIRAVPPAGCLTWEAGRLRVDGMRVEPTRLDISRAAAIDRYVELFGAALAKDEVDPARTLVPLSGGRDSRHILLELHRAGHPVPCVTVRPSPPKADEDAIVAATVAAAVGVPHTIVEQSEDRCGKETEKNLRTSLCTLEHSWVMDLVQSLAGRDVVLYDGIAGDTLSEAKYMTAERLARLRRRDLRGYAEAELTTEGYLPALLRRSIYRRFSRGLALERLEAELLTHVDAPNPVGSYRFWNRTRRAVALAPFGLLASVATVRAPFLDPDLQAFLASLPGELLVDRTFHTDTIARAYPAFASLPYENPKAPRRSAVVSMRRFGLAALRRELALRASGGLARMLVRHEVYMARLAVLLASPRRAENVGALARTGLYLSQVEEQLAAAQ